MACDFRQDLVTLGVAIRIIDGFEIIQIECNAGELAAWWSRARLNSDLPPARNVLGGTVPVRKSIVASFRNSSSSTTRRARSWRLVELSLCHFTGPHILDA